MKIRSITYFTNPGWPLAENKLRQAGRFLSEAREAFTAAGYDVQTTRLATIPFAHILGEKRLAELPRMAEAMESALRQIGVEYASLGPALIEIPESYAPIPEAVAASQNLFFSAEMANRASGLSLQAVRASAEIIVRCAPLLPDGFANLRFAALANVPPGAPFFPAPSHAGELPVFALATEAAGLAVQAFGQAKSIADGRQNLVEALEQHAHALQPTADLLKFRFNARYGGIDFSLAPFPEEAQSLGAAFERLGVRRVGLHGSLAAAAVLAEAIDRAQFPRAGFSGLMLPVLEDAVLARRAAEGTLTVKDLLLYSAVCGTGLDTVPLPGDATADQIAALLLDLAALALRLDKPLTARLMPVPGKQAGDPTGFDFDFFANSRVMALQAQALQEPLGGTEIINIHPRQH